MLVSHRCRFIFIKTMKTAGTSVEAYFEPSCLPDGTVCGEEYRSQLVTESGIVGFRGFPRPWPFRSKWYNHMPAQAIRRLVGERIWNEYFKFTIVRDPFEKLVSSFFFQAKSPGLFPRVLPTELRRWHGVLRKSVAVVGRNDRETIRNFRSWVRHGTLPEDRDLYCIEGRESVDYFIRYESLAEGVETVCDRVGVHFEPRRFPAFKSTFRDRGISTRDFYDEATEALVRERFAWEIARFKYDLPR